MLIAADANGKPRQSAGFYLELSAYWFALSFLWGGMITIVMQRLVLQMAGDQKDLYLGWTLGLGAAVSTVVCLVMGAASDRSRWSWGRRRPYILVGTLLAVPSLLALPLARSIPELILAFCAIQLFTNLATAPYQALVPDLVPRERQGAASAWMGMGSLLGQLGGLILCAALITRPHGLETIMRTLAALLAAAMLWTVFRIPEASAAANPAPTSGFLTNLRNAFRVDLRSHPSFGWLIASRFAINMGFYTATEFLLYYVRDTLHAARPESTVGLIFIIVTIAGLAGNFPAGLLADRMSKKLVVYISSAVTAVAALVFLVAQSLPVAMAASCIFGAGFGAFAAVDWALATNLMPERDEARYMGVWHISFTVPQVVAPLIGGVLAYAVNRAMGPGVGYRAVLALVLVYFAIGVACIRPVKERAIARPAAAGSGT
ncbi:MAG TPA: MFS transporter [Armatimonadota bacterium]|jgi:MFS family permease